MADVTEDMTRTGEALHHWYMVLFENHTLAEYEDGVEAMRGLSEMKDTDNNRDELIVAASRIGLPDVDVATLEEWVNADRVKSDKFPADKAFFSKDVHEMMATDLHVFEAED